LALVELFEFLVVVMRQPVLTIFYQFNPWHSTIGGIQTVIRSFIKYAPSELIVRLVGTASTPAMPTGQWQEAELAGRPIQFMPLIHVPNDNIRKRIPTTVSYTLALLKHRFASDFMHFHRLEPSLAAVGWAGDKTLFIHNDIHQQIAAARNQSGKTTILWQHLPAAYFALERLLVNQFNQILSCNSESACFYRQQYPAIANKVSLIKNTVDSEVFYPLAPTDRQANRIRLTQHLHLPPETRFILFAGRLHPQKDPLLLLRSIAALNDPTVHLLVAGDGELTAAMQAEIASLRLTHQVTLLGALPQAELANLHRVCSVLVLTSTHEGLPLVVLEALACGTPVVTTRCGETPHLLSAESGIVCDDRTPPAIADAIRRVLLNADTYSIESCVRAAQPYGARAVISHLYDDMLSRWQP
jgi:glycosyltransferase involved in cell wall biosynthesis